VKEFVKKYKDDGIIWYLESCDLTVLDQYRGLWQLKNAGWFENCKGIMYGRPQRPEPIFDVTVKELLKNNFKELGIPVIYDMDFGHVAPIWTILSGSMATVECIDGKGRITFEQK
jgi:muramoyltetrapeptide carboxypeptidase LdcA involved in peptidoglycan recycling